MNIYPNTTTSYIEQNGTPEQKMLCSYFDEDDNGIIDSKEATKFNFSKIKINDKNITIQNQGKTDVFENMSIRHTDDYYKSGFIPVAVLDDYTMGNSGALDHGYITCNVLKKYNPDLSLDRIETNPTRAYNKLQKFIENKLANHPKLGEFVSKHQWIEALIFGKDPDSISLQMALDDLNERIGAGIKYKAVNLSLAYGFEYSEINRLVSGELGIEITPDNIAEYKEQILEILKTKKDESIIQDCKGKKSFIKIATLLKMIDSIEKTKVPFYMASSYKTTDGNNNETWSFLALANNAICVEAGRIDKNGNITHSQSSTHNSLSTKNGKKYIEDSSTMYCGDSILGGGTSFATPMALAKDFKI